MGVIKETKEYLPLSSRLRTVELRVVLLALVALEFRLAEELRWVSEVVDLWEARLGVVSVILRFPRIRDFVGDLVFGDAKTLLRDLEAY